MHGSRRVLAIGVLAIAALTAAPGPASAGEVTAAGGTARFADPSGAADRLSAHLQLVQQTPDVDPQGWSVSFLAFGDPALTWGAGCGEGFVGALCPFGGTPPTALALDLGGGDDELDLEVEPEAAGAPTQITVAGGPGNDGIATVQARARIDGGDGNDVIKPDEHRALDFPPGPTPGGVIGGGAGVDTVDYEQALDPISVSLDGVADDGRAGEGDNVQANVENIVGGNFGGTLVGNVAANTIAGGGEADRLAGRAGRDSLDARSGNDSVDALDASGGDRVDCGEGVDVAWLDAGDTAATGCEQVAWAPRAAFRALRLRNGRIAVSLSCPRAAQGCRGALLLRSLTKRPKTLARVSYRAKRNKRATVRMKPTSAGRSALRRRRAVNAELMVQPRGTKAAGGRPVTVRR